MSKDQWIFTEEQRKAVCEGDLCPRCLSINIKCVGVNPDGMNINAAYDCEDCGEKWEGY